MPNSAGGPPAIDTCIFSLPTSTKAARGSSTATSLIQALMFFCCPFWCEAPPRAQPRFEIANLSNGKRNARQNVQSPAIGANLMAGQPSAPEDHAATLLQAEPRSHDTVFMVRVQRRFRSWGLMVRSREAASRTMRPQTSLHPSRRAFRAPQDEG